ncbi:unnamed protein product [Tetraodon nigroviridis]|uniref:(spotted green pufferfish) hypothetical protein n=1 Tax=Tetraodon nigroviridis TaxID=99883 RepID=Q4SD47_TETNG|nr:unnamed protein product [Tetraodon nigroviridis]
MDLNKFTAPPVDSGTPDGCCAGALPRTRECHVSLRDIEALCGRVRTVDSGSCLPKTRALEHNGLFTSPSLHSPTDSQGLPGAATVQLRPPQMLLGCSDDPGLVPALELQIVVKQEQLGARALRKASKRHPLRDAGPQHLQ